MPRRASCINCARGHDTRCIRARHTREGLDNYRRYSVNSAISPIVAIVYRLDGGALHTGAVAAFRDPL